MLIVRGVVISWLVEIIPRLVKVVERVSHPWILEVLLIVIIPRTAVIILLLWERVVIRWSNSPKILVIVWSWRILIRISPVVVCISLKIAVLPVGCESII